MKISEAWLRQWVNPPVTTEELSSQLTMAGLEVKGIEPVAGPFSGLVAAEILSTRAHPDSDKLQVCQVHDGQKERQVVCGASNARPGIKAPFAPPGASLGAESKIQKVQLRGVESEGMLCSAAELGLSDDHSGLMELPLDVPAGAELRSLLQLHDQSIELDLTPNRSDCLCTAGLARELGVLNNLPLTPPPRQPAEVQSRLTFPVQVSAPKACPRYAARVIEGVDPGLASPLWLQERLRRAGLRSLDAVVDVTNYVMLELGQPLHAFDLDQLQGGINVRLAEENESLVLLDGKTRQIQPGSLLITDAAGPVALAGIMGGQSSAVSAATRNILLESAFFAPSAMAGRARIYGMQTDASHRFERGVDPWLQIQALEAATCLLLEITGGRAGPLCEATSEHLLPKNTEISLRSQRIHRLLGVSLAADEIEQMLDRLGFTFTRNSAEADTWQVRAPSHRFDIALEADLIEEIARIHGYDRLPVTLPPAKAPAAPRKETRLPWDRLRRQLTALGYHEIITYSFVDRRLENLLYPEQQQLLLKNPISSELDVMRTGLWTGLIKTLMHNLNRQQDRVRIFEMGLAFQHPGNMPLNLATLQQKKRLAGLISGRRFAESWSVADREVDFFDLKGDVETLLRSAGQKSVHFRPAAVPALHPGQTAAVFLGDEQLGLLGRLHPELQASLELDQAVFMFDLAADRLVQGHLPVFAEVSRFPEVRRDLAVLVPRELPAAEVLASAREAAGTWLRNLKLFDVYDGEGIDSSVKSLGLGLIFQHPSRTLTDTEISESVRAVLALLETRHAAALRGPGPQE